MLALLLALCATLFLFFWVLNRLWRSRQRSVLIRRIAALRARLSDPAHALDDAPTLERQAAELERALADLDRLKDLDRRSRAGDDKSSAILARAEAANEKTALLQRHPPDAYAGIFGADGRQLKDRAGATACVVGFPLILLFFSVLAWGLYRLALRQAPAYRCVFAPDAGDTGRGYVPCTVQQNG